MNFTIIFVTTSVFRVNFKGWSDYDNVFFVLSMYLAEFERADREFDNCFCKNSCPNSEM